LTLLLNRELVSRAKLCLVSVFPDTVKDCPKIRNLAKIFLRSFENVGPGLYSVFSRWLLSWKGLTSLRLRQHWLFTGPVHQLSSVPIPGLS